MKSGKKARFFSENVPTQIYDFERRLCTQTQKFTSWKSFTYLKGIVKHL